MRNRYLRLCVCIAFVLGSAFSLLAQSDGVDVQRQDNVQPVSYTHLDVYKRQLVECSENAFRGDGRDEFRVLRGGDAELRFFQDAIALS